MTPVGDYRDPEFRRAEIARLRDANAAAEDEMRARWMTEALPDQPEPPPAKPSAQRPPQRLLSDAEIGALVSREIDTAVRDLLDSVGEVVAVERAAHAKAIRALKFQIRDLRRELRQRERDKVRLVA